MPARNPVLRVCLLAALLSGASVASAIDAWDLSPSDNNSGTDNELVHGSDQLHDLQHNAGVADEDWFRLGRAPYSSYEIVVDGLTEEVAVVPSDIAGDVIGLDLVDSNGTLESSGLAITGHASSRSLRVRNTTGAELLNRFVRVKSAAFACASNCTTNAEYRIRMRETTLMIPRFNNTGTQVTVLIMQNGSRATVNGTARFWSMAGSLLASQNFSMPARGGFVVGTGSIAGASGASGVITVDHDGPYGQVTGKSVALEPATGFSFDSPAVPRIY